jgi:hypothetical protein
MLNFSLRKISGPPHSPFQNPGMLHTMRHIEIHTIETETDGVSAFNSGLIPEPFFASVCSGCGDSIGSLEVFEPYVVVLEDEDEWYLCFYCAESVTDPEIANALPDLSAFADDDDEDIEPF